MVGWDGKSWPPPEEIPQAEVMTAMWKRLDEAYRRIDALSAHVHPLSHQSVKSHGTLTGPPQGRGHF
jgi:hypothetical protein